MEETTTATPKSLDEHMREFEQWLKDRHLQPVIVAQGVITGAIMPIDDFWRHEGHKLTIILQPAQR